MSMNGLETRHVSNDDLTMYIQGIQRWVENNLDAQ